MASISHDTVKLGPLTTRMWLGRDGRWRWHSYEGGKRVLRSAGNLHKARQKAKAGLLATRDGRAHLIALDPVVVSEFLEWQKARSSTLPLDEARELYVADMKRRKTSALHHEKVAAILLRFCNAHPKRSIGSIEPEDVAKWLEKANAPRTQRNLRAALAGWFRWARRNSHLPDKTTAPEKVPAPRVVADQVVVYTPSELVDLLAEAPPQWRLAIALGAFAGLRSAEIEALRWEDMKLARQHIEVRAKISKTRRRRLVPICPALKAWIKASDPCESQMAAPRERIDNMARHLKGWKKNALRHSYGSYRMAITKNAAKVSLEMGNSAAVVMAHYNEAQTSSAAREWFAIRPPASNHHLTKSAP